MKADLKDKISQMSKEECLNLAMEALGPQTDFSGFLTSKNPSISKMLHKNPIVFDLVDRIKKLKAQKNKFVKKSSLKLTNSLKLLEKV